MFGPNKDSGDDSRVCARWPPCVPSIPSYHPLADREQKIIKISRVNIQCLFEETILRGFTFRLQETIWKVMVMIVMLATTMAQRLSHHERVSSGPGSRILIRAERHCVRVRILMMPPTPSPVSRLFRVPTVH